MMDVVLQQFDMRAGTHHAYAQWSKPMFGSAEVANFKALDPYIALVVNGKYRLPAGGSEMRCIENRGFAGIASQSNVSISRVARRP